MNRPAERRAIAPVAPKTSIAAAGWDAWQPQPPKRGKATPPSTGAPLLPYPLDLAPARVALDSAGVPYTAARGDAAPSYDPLAITRYGLTAWNTYLQTGEEQQCAAFLTQARWLLEHEVALPEGGGGWPIAAPRPEYYAFLPWLSARAQSGALSILTRAYQLTGDATYLDAAGRAAATCARDILDGGVVAPAGYGGAVFEEVAVYPAAHALGGFLETFIGLYDYLAFADEPALAPTLDSAHATLHSLLKQYDTGYWTRADLLRNRLATPRQHRLHAILLGTLARFSGCPECAARAKRWRAYTHHPLRRSRAAVSRRLGAARDGWRRLARRVAYPRAAAAAMAAPASPLPVSIPITAYPMAGGMRAVMRAWTSVMLGLWNVRFLTRKIGPRDQDEVIESFELKFQPFGQETSAPSQFPNVWLYQLAGYRALPKLLRRHPEIRLLLPQDGLYTAAFTSVIGRRAGVRVVSMDHGNVRVLFDPMYRQEMVQSLRRYNPIKRVLARVRLRFYWPSLRLLARVAVRHTDGFLVASDQTSDLYQEKLGVPAYKISRIPWSVDTDRLAPLTGAERLEVRQRIGVPADAILISMVNRFSVEKGMDIAIPALGELYGALPEALRGNVRVVIAGDGPLRPRVESEIRQLGLEGVCRLWGMAAPDDVAALLSISDIFLYTGVKDTNPVTVIEAMSAGCASVGTMSTRHIAMNYADGRGIAVPVGDTHAIGAALAELVLDERKRHEIGARARQYVLTRHTPELARRALWRATLYQPALPTSRRSAATASAASVPLGQGERMSER